MPHIESKLVRAPAGDPNQCKATYASGQCPYLAAEGSERCVMHGAHKQQQAAAAKGLRNFRLAQWQNRMSELADSDGVKSLRDEIGILRMTLEAIVLKCKDETDLILYAPRIGDMIVKIEKVVTSCHRLEQSTGMLLDKAAALTLAAQIVEIIGRHVTNPEIADTIANEIGLAIMNVGKEETPDG